MWEILKSIEKWFFKHWIILTGIYSITACFLIYLLYTDQDYNSQLIRIASGRESDDSYKAAKIIADHINSKNTYLELQVLQTEGSTSNTDLLLEGQVDLALVHYSPDLVGTAHSLAILFDDAVQIISQPHLKINTFSDLVGKTVAFATNKSIEPRVFQLMVDHYNLTGADIRTVETSSTSAMWGFRQRLIDVIFRVKFANNREVSDFIAETDANIWGVDQSKAIEFKYPYFKEINIPEGTYKGSPAIPRINLQTIGIERFLVASGDLNPNVVRDITEILFEDREFMVLKSNLFGFVKIPNVTTLIPPHSGATAYFQRESPHFIQENAELLALMVTLLAIFGSVLINFNKVAKRKRVNDYNRKLLALKLKIENAKDHLQLRQFKEELDGFIGRVVDDAVASKISSEGFEFFAFTWENVKGMMIEKEKQLEK